MDQWISRLGYGRSRCGSVSLWHDFGSRIVQKEQTVTNYHCAKKHGALITSIKW